MSVWIPSLAKMNQANAQDKQLRISNLSRYIESIQTKEVSESGRRPVGVYDSPR